MKDQRYHQYTTTAIIVNIIERSQAYSWCSTGGCSMSWFV